MRVGEGAAEAPACRLGPTARPGRAARRRIGRAWEREEGEAIEEQEEEEGEEMEEEEEGGHGAPLAPVTVAPASIERMKTVEGKVEEATRRVRERREENTQRKRKDAEESFFFLVNSKPG